MWFIPYDTINSKNERPHPAWFPIKLPEMCIRLHGLKEELVVMDTFSGIGSTALVFSRLDVSFVGFEIDEAYLMKSIDRMSGNIMFY